MKDEEMEEGGHTERSLKSRGIGNGHSHSAVLFCPTESLAGGKDASLK